MASKIFDTQQWRVYCDTEESQTSATNLKVFAKSPSGTEVEFVGVLDGGDNNRIYYDVAADELTEIGMWYIWPKTTIAGNTSPGDPQVVEIFAEGT